MKSRIPWTEQTWNPFEGCTHATDGCAHCCAERFAGRFCGTGGITEGLAVSTPDGARWTGNVRVMTNRLDQPRRNKQPTVYFVNSRSDTFHKGFSVDQILGLFDTMRECPQHVFIILTKRVQRLLSVLYGPEGGHYLGSNDSISNVWLGASLSRQRDVDSMLPVLFACGPGWHYLVSVEPMLEALDFTPPEFRGMGTNRNLWLRFLDWAICSGETGKDSRPMHPQWARDFRDACLNRTDAWRPWPLPFFFKSWGDWKPSRLFGHKSINLYRDGTSMEVRCRRLDIAEEPVQMTRHPKDRDCFLDGKKYLQFPCFKDGDPPAATKMAARMYAKALEPFAEAACA
jgi:protein gp37